MKRPIFFLKYNQFGSAILRADHVSQALQRNGLPAQSIFCHEGAISDALVFIIKYINGDYFEELASRNNRIVFDAVDMFANIDFASEPQQAVRRAFRHVDAVIHPNALSVSRHRGLFRDDALHRVIHHHWDPRLPQRPKPASSERRFKIAYLGAMENFVDDERLSFIPRITRFEDQLRNAARFNCHFSVRTGPEGKRLFKPATKHAIAAAAGSNIITSRDVSAIELLGPDYPYFTAPDTDSILETIWRAREEFGGPEWTAGLEKMREVREKTSLEHICSQYERLVEDVSA